MYKPTPKGMVGFKVTPSSGTRAFTNGNEWERDGETYVVGDTSEGRIIVKTSSYSNLYREEGVDIFKEKVDGVMTNLTKDELKKVLRVLD